MELFKPGNDTYFNARPKPNVRLKPSDSSFYLNLSLEWSLTFEHPYDEEGRWKLIEGDSVILIESPFHLSKQAFVVNGIEKGLYSMTVTCHHYFIESAYEQVMDRRAVNAMPQEALDVLFEDTEFKGKAEAGFITENSIYFIQDNILNFIRGSNKENTLHNRWGGEFFYDNRTLKWYESLNKDKIFKISFGQNLTDLGLEEDWKGVYTRIYPKAYNGRLVSAPYYVDSPNINKYAKVKATWLDFDDIGLRTDYENYNPESPPEDITLFETMEELEEAIKERVKQLFDEGLDLPTITGTVNAAMLHNSINREGTIEVPGLGYTIKAYNKLTNMEYQSRIIGIDWNTVKNCFNSIELGDSAEANTNFFEKIESTVDKVVDDLEESNKTDWNQVIKDTMDELTDYINNGTYYGHIKITKHEFLILDHAEIDQARKVWRWNMGGLGFSTNGYGGPYETAITAAGKMLINELTAETIRASMIKAGILSSMDNECWIDLDNGTFNFADKIKWDGEQFSVDIKGEDLHNNPSMQLIINTLEGLIATKISKEDHKSSLELTASALRLEFEQADKNLASSLERTAESLRSEYKDADKKLEGVITQTANNLKSDYTDKVNGLSSSLSQTAGSLEAKITDAKNNLQAQITVNKNAISQKVESKDFQSYKNQTDRELTSKVASKDLSTLVKQGADSWGISINGKLKGTNYNFDGNNFSIGTTNGNNKAYHSATESIWKHSDGSYTKVSANGLEKYHSGTKDTYHYYLKVGDVLLNSGDQVRIQAPSHILAKESVILAIEQYVSPHTNNYIYSLNTSLINVFYENGQFMIQATIKWNNLNTKQVEYGGFVFVHYVVVG